MAVVLGTNAGFVTTAPTADPAGSSFTQDSAARCHKHTCPAAVDKITEIGWYQNTFESGGNYEVGLYSHDAGNDTADTLLYSNTTNAMTGNGWNVVTGLNWSVTPGTIYWIGLQIDNTVNPTNMDYKSTGGRAGIRTSMISLPDPFSSLSDTDYILALYAKVELVSDEYAEGTKTVTTAASVELASENYVDNQGAVPNRPTDYDPDEYWDEDAGAWSATRTTHPGNWSQNLLAISDEGEIYFRTI
jgi:hypothetical protein